MSKMIFELGYFDHNNEDVVYPERHVMTGYRRESDAVNAIIQYFNKNHPCSDRIDYIERLDPGSVIKGLSEIVSDYGSGTLVFTDADFTTVQDAIALLELLKG